MGGSEPRWLITDKLGSYRAAHRSVLPSVERVTARYANNRAEDAHQPTRQRERQMRKFKSAAWREVAAAQSGRPCYPRLLEPRCSDLNVTVMML